MKEFEPIYPDEEILRQILIAKFDLSSAKDNEIGKLLYSVVLEILVLTVMSEIKWIDSSYLFVVIKYAITILSIGSFAYGLWRTSKRVREEQIYVERKYKLKFYGNSAGSIKIGSLYFLNKSNYRINDAKRKKVKLAVFIDGCKYCFWIKKKNIPFVEINNRVYLCFQEREK